MIHSLFGFCKKFAVIFQLPAILKYTQLPIYNRKSYFTSKSLTVRINGVHKPVSILLKNQFLRHLLLMIVAHNQKRQDFLPGPPLNHYFQAGNLQFISLKINYLKIISGIFIFFGLLLFLFGINGQITNLTSKKIKQ